MNDWFKYFGLPGLIASLLCFGGMVLMEWVVQNEERPKVKSLLRFTRGTYSRLVPSDKANEAWRVFWGLLIVGIVLWITRDYPSHSPFDY